MENNFMIMIPTYRRSDHLMSGKTNVVLPYIPEELKSNTRLVVRQEEINAYKQVSDYWNISQYAIHIPDRITHGIARTRDTILQYGIDNNITHLIMMDDDLRLAVRNGSTYRNMGTEDFAEMVDWLIDNCDEQYPCTSITTRQFSHKKPIIEYNTRVIQLFCLHMSTIDKIGVFFNQSGMYYMTDYYFTLRLLTEGYQNKVITQYTRDELAQYPGGCEVDRTVDAYNESAKQLYRMFPKYVRLEWKESSSWGERRITPYVNWKKAAKDGQRSRNE